MPAGGGAGKAQQSGCTGLEKFLGQGREEVGKVFPHKELHNSSLFQTVSWGKKKKKEKRIIYLEGLDEAWMLSRAGNRGKRCLCNPSALPPSAGLLNRDRLPRRCLLTPRSCISLLPRRRTAPPAHRRGRRKHKKKQKTHAGKAPGTVQLINCNH